VSAQRGFTLVEIAIAAALLLLAVTSGLTLVASGRGAHRSAESRARLEETARAALDVLAYEVRLAGYLGRLAPGSTVQGSAVAGTAPPSGLAVAGGCTDSLALDLDEPLAGADDDYGAGNGLPLRCRPSPAGRVVAGADTLIVRRAAVLPGRPAAGRLQLESTRRMGRLFTDGGTLLGALADVHDIETSVFYVSQDATGAPGYPSLRRKRLVGGSAPAFQDEELVAGVADLQVEVAVQDGDGGIVFVPFDRLERGVAIRSVRIWVLAQAELGEPLAHGLPALTYSNRVLPASGGRHARLLASRSVEPRNLGVRP